MNEYKIQYLGEGRTIDRIKARCPKEALRKIVNLKYFTAKKINP